MIENAELYKAAQDRGIIVSLIEQLQDDIFRFAWWTPFPSSSPITPQIWRLMIGRALLKSGFAFRTLSYGLKRVPHRSGRSLRTQSRVWVAFKVWRRYAWKKM